MPNAHSLRWLFALMLFALIAGVTAAPQLFAKDMTPTLLIEQPWARGTPKSASVGAGYLKITNKSEASDFLLGASSPVSPQIEIHEMVMSGDVMQMRPVSPKGLEIKPSETVELKPGGMHIMFMNLAKPPKEGESFDVILKFAHAGDVTAAFKVAAPGATANPHSH